MCSALVHIVVHLNNRFMLRLLLMYMIMSNDKLVKIQYSLPSLLPVSGDRHRTTSYRRNQIQALYQPSCNTPNDCQFDNSFCNKDQKKCRCKKDHVQVASFVNKSYISHLAMTCVTVARLNERCISDHQCIVDYSDCRLVNQKVGNINQTMHICKCTPGHGQEENESSEVLLNGYTYHVKPICGFSRHHNSSWLTTLIIISLLVIFILIGTFVAIVKYQRWRNQPFAATMTSIASGQGMAGHHASNRMAISGSPPPMGSVEAEFQNDFIQVFPMHHLEPMPDKNVHAFMMK